jgi:hypothetical protein
MTCQLCALTWCHRNLAIQAQRHLHRNEWPAAALHRKESLVETRGLRLADTDRDRNPPFAEIPNTGPTNTRVRVFHSDYDRCQTGLHDPFDTRSSSAFMATGLQRAIEPSPRSGVTGFVERNDFGMSATGTSVVSASDHVTALGHQGADHRIWTRCATPACRQRKGLGH